jgi:uncharacterized protein YlaN (UPF0358 family)
MDTIGNLIDKLTIANCRLWAIEDVKRKDGATDKELADATRLSNIVNQQRTDLIQEIDEKLNDIAEGKKQKLYKQGSTKMYGKR